MSKEVKKRIMSHLAEFFVVGLVMGITEDILAIKFATNAKITIETFKVAFLVALPFAVISELLVDSKIIREMVFKKRNSKK
jgi:hypothetical protein